jgi:hypothetical protein
MLVDLLIVLCSAASGGCTAALVFWQLTGKVRRLELQLLDVEEQILHDKKVRAGRISRGTDDLLKEAQEVVEKGMKGAPVAGQSIQDWRWSRGLKTR